MKARAALVFCIAALLHAATARAGEEDDARAAMRRGHAALEREDLAAALSEYQEAQRLVPTANAPYYFAGDVLGRLERWREAVESFDAYLAKDPNVSDAEQVKARIAKIRAEHFPARLMVTVVPADAVVSIDGAARGAPSTYELAPGEHHVDVRAEAYEPAAHDVVLTGDTDSRITIVLSKIRRPIAAVPPSVRAESPSHWRTVGWIGTGLGAAGLAATLVVDAAVLGAKVDAYERAADRSDVDAARRSRDEAGDLRTGIVVGYAVSGALALGGLAVVLLAPATTSRTGITPLVGPGLAGISTRFPF